MPADVAGQEARIFASSFAVNALAWQFPMQACGHATSSTTLPDPRRRVSNGRSAQDPAGDCISEHGFGPREALLRLLGRLLLLGTHRRAGPPVEWPREHSGRVLSVISPVPLGL